MTDQLIIMFVDMFYDLEKKGKDGFILVKLSVPMKILYELYERLIKVDVPAIETLSIEEKNKYWNMAKKYHTDEKQAIKASKAAYILQLITAN